MRILALILVFCLPGFVMAQSDLPEKKPLKITAKPEQGATSSNSGVVLRMPSVIEPAPRMNLRDSIYSRNIKMLPDKQLKQAGFDLDLNPKVNEANQGKGNSHYGDMYLGDVKTGGKFVGIVCRDHEYVDGDRVKIYANDRVVDHNVLLTGRFQGVNVELDEGFNRLEFEALNQGSTGPNTAQVDVYDENGKLIYSNRWLLSTGSKASLIIVKNE